MKLNDNKNLPEFLYNKIIHILFSAIYININITDLEKKTEVGMIEINKFRKLLRLKE